MILFKSPILIPVILLLISSCDCVQQLELTILDQNTHKNISNVEIYDTNTLVKKEFIEKEGHYSFHKIAGFCPGFSLTLEKQGYKTEKLLFDSHIQTDTIYLTPVNVPSL